MIEKAKLVINDRGRIYATNDKDFANRDFEEVYIIDLPTLDRIKSSIQSALESGEIPVSKRVKLHFCIRELTEEKK